jgi:hypothetical protein
MSSEFTNAVQDICEILMFENWLRFYFIKEGEGDTLTIEVPEASLARITEQHAHLVPLVEALNGQVIDHTTSQQAVCTYVAAHVEGQRMRDGVPATVFGSTTFQNEIQLFGVWVQTHEEQLDKGFLDFATWKALFAEWRNSDKVKAKIDAAREASTRASTTSCDTVQ